jgi:6-phosphofructo-2-kinase/fructose-2,6-biphosphatase 2
VKTGTRTVDAVQIAPESSKLAVVMVGLPARGKSYTARRIERYLSWLGYRTGVFNVGEYRRKRRRPRSAQLLRSRQPAGRRDAQVGCDGGARRHGDVAHERRAGRDL